MASLLQTIQLPDYVEQLLVRKLQNSDVEVRGEQEKQNVAAEQAMVQSQKELRVLVDLRVRDMIDDAEYLEQRRKLQGQEMRMREAASRRAMEPPLWLELGQSVIMFRKYAADWFRAGISEDKRLILKTVGSNSVLADKKLSVHARFPFKWIENPDDFPRWCG